MRPKRDDQHPALGDLNKGEYREAQRAYARMLQMSTRALGAVLASGAIGYLRRLDSDLRQIEVIESGGDSRPLMTLVVSRRAAK